VDTTLGTTVAWNNTAVWGNNWTNPNVNVIPVADADGDGLCDYLRDVQPDEFNIAAGNVIPWAPPIGAIAGPIATPTNDVCLLGADDGTATLSTFGYVQDVGDPANAVPPIYAPPGEYVGEDFADSFNANYFTGTKTLSGGTFGPTLFSITPIHVDDTANPVTGWANPPFPPAWFVGIPFSAFFNIGDDTSSLAYQFDLEVYDHNEVSYSAPPKFVICHGLRTIHQLSNNITLNLRQGHVNIWDVDRVFGAFASEDAALVGIDTLNNISGNAALDAAFAVYPTHNRTTAPMSLFDFFLGLQSPTLYDTDATGSTGSP
jgi:hypothetical protein